MRERYRRELRTVQTARLLYAKALYMDPSVARSSAPENRSPRRGEIFWNAERRELRRSPVTRCNSSKDAECSDARVLARRSDGSAHVQLSRDLANAEREASTSWNRFVKGHSRADSEVRSAFLRRLAPMLPSRALEKLIEDSFLGS